MVKPANLVFILSDEHSRNAGGCYGHPMNPTPNIDRLARMGTRFDRAYTTCPICIPARASLATGRYVHQIRYWDNGIPYDGEVPSWHHVLRAQSHRVDSIGKLHFRGKEGDDNGFTKEIDPLHVVDAKGDVLGCIRDDAPKRHKRPGIEEAGPGDSTYIRYDTSNGDRACTWIREHAKDERPWILQAGFVFPHPPYVAPPKLYDRYPVDRVPMPPQWRKEEWPDHPTLNAMREFFDFDRPFDEEVVRRLNAAYLGSCTHMDHQIGRIIETLEELGDLENTRIIYTSDHGENRGARGLFGKFTMYEESAGIPLIMAGPEIPAGKVVNTPVSLIDCYPTMLEAVGADDPENGSLPGESLFGLAEQEDHDRTILSEYHALGSRRGYFMLLRGRYKLVYYVDAPNQLFDLEADPREEHDLAASTGHSGTLARLEAELRTIVDPEEADRQAREDQAAFVEREGGREKLAGRGSFDNSPVPGEAPKFH